MFCLKHISCNHGVVECTCNVCWNHDRQCDWCYTDNTTSTSDSTEQPVVLGGRDREGELANNNEPQGYENLYCTETLCNSATFAERDNNERTNRGHQAYLPQSTQLSVRPGTAEYTGFHFPITGSDEWAYYIRNIDEYQQSEDKKRLINNYIEHARTIYTEYNMDNDRRQGELHNELFNEQYRGGNNSMHDSAERPSTSKGTIQSTVDKEGIHNNGTHSTREGGSSETTGKTGTPGEKRKREKSTDDNSKQKKKATSDELGRRGSESESSEYGGRFRYHTFIIHKKNQRDNWKREATGKKAPQFASFDHGDHYHIIYGSNQEQNISRTRTRIGKYLGASSAGIAEINLTGMRIRLLRNFILYCIRYGLKTLSHYGNGVKKELKLLDEMIQALSTDQDNIIEDGSCKEYIEKRKEEEGDPRIGSIKRGAIVDVIQHLIKEYKIKSFSDWELKIPCETKDQLLRDFGLQAETYAAKIIKNIKFKTTCNIKYKSYEDTILELTQKIKLNEASKIMTNCKWIIYLFRKNNLSLSTFLYWVTQIKNMTFTKINGLVLEGFTNAGKSLLIDIAIQPCKPEEIPRERDNNGFHLDQLPFASCALFEEPLITPINVGTWKLLLEGKTIKTDIKHKDKEGISRLPIFITTASPITSCIDNREGEQILQRIKIFKFCCTIEHRTETARIENCAVILRKPPHYITSEDLAFCYALHYENILALEKTTTKTLTLNPERIIASDETKEKLRKHGKIYKSLWHQQEQSSEEQLTHQP